MFASNKMFINESYYTRNIKEKFIIQKCTLYVTDGKVHADLSHFKKINSETIVLKLLGFDSYDLGWVKSSP